MSKMADLDIILTDYKLSDAQKNAVVELLGGGFTTAKANTIKSLETKGLVINKGDFYIFEEEFKAKLKGTREVVTNQVMAHPDVLSDILEKEETTDGWMGEDEAPLADGVERFQDDWEEWEKELAGFGETLKWKNAQVWDGLTAQEIRDDLDTARLIGRKARRERRRQVQKALSGL